MWWLVTLLALGITVIIVLFSIMIYEWLSQVYRLRRARERVALNRSRVDEFNAEIKRLSHGAWFLSSVGWMSASGRSLLRLDKDDFLIMKARLVLRATPETREESGPDFYEAAMIEIRFEDTVSPAGAANLFWRQIVALSYLLVNDETTWACMERLIAHDQAQPGEIPAWHFPGFSELPIVEPVHLFKSEG